MLPSDYRGVAGRRHHKNKTGLHNINTSDYIYAAHRSEGGLKVPVTSSTESWSTPNPSYSRRLKGGSRAGTDRAGTYLIEFVDVVGQQVDYLARGCLPHGRVT